MTTAAAQTKQCTKCGEMKPLDDFDLRPERPGGCGYQSRCRVCRAAASRVRMRKYDPASVKEMRKARELRNTQRELTPREKDPGQQKRCPQCNETKAMSEFYASRSRADGCVGLCKVCSKTRTAHWRIANPEQCKVALAHWREQNPDQVKKNRRDWTSQNRAKTREKTRHRTALKHQLHETFAAEMDTFVRDFWENRCAICGRWHTPGAAAFPIDHWQPLSKGHVLTMTNAVLLCKQCNSSKGNRDPGKLYSADVIRKVVQKLEWQAAAWEIRASCVEGLAL